MIRKAEITIPVTNDMRDNAIGGIDGILKSHAADRGVPVDLIKPTTQASERLPHVTEYTWTWWTIDKLPAAQSFSGGASCGYTHQWDGVGLTADGDVQVFGLGYLNADAAETLALEMLAAVHFAREKEQVQIPAPADRCACGHYVDKHTITSSKPGCLATNGDGRPCVCPKFISGYENEDVPVSDVTPCLRSSNCTLTHNHRGDCELRYP